MTRHLFFADLDNNISKSSSSPSVESVDDDSYDLTSPVSAFLERSRKQVEKYFRRLTQPEEPGQNGKHF